MHTRMCVTFYVIVKRSKRFHGDHGGAADDPIMQTKEMKRITYWGLGLNVVLTATKAVLGYAMNSASVLAEAVHSLSDMISDFVTLGTVSFSRRPPNKRWIYGYGKLETVKESGFHNA
ncbi:metal transporter [Blastocystis sp. subtype 4]|uniref:metal transporter n=1 Tax=Blastocystis sp. subtype 4 TaxID=944170 RepID=UPI0007120E04|nr:metal transporter [Blastocystis sp. subtype 4]KNB43893.1 metal transporter [Blastocystis sp. subtype 4]|eukprot:XP_014527331.1 metal transporter [Blastocystis sp. subtype 4]